LSGSSSISVLPTQRRNKETFHVSPKKRRLELRIIPERSGGGQASRSHIAGQLSGRRPQTVDAKAARPEESTTVAARRWRSLPGPRSVIKLGHLPKVTRTPRLTKAKAMIRPGALPVRPA
jgi:hypothetical protein